MTLSPFLRMRGTRRDLSIVPSARSSRGLVVARPIEALCLRLATKPRAFPLTSTQGYSLASSFSPDVSGFFFFFFLIRVQSILTWISWLIPRIRTAAGKKPTLAHWNAGGTPSRAKAVSMSQSGNSPSNFLSPSPVPSRESNEIKYETLFHAGGGGDHFQMALFFTWIGFVSLENKNLNEWLAGLSCRLIDWLGHLLYLLWGLSQGITSSKNRLWTSILNLAAH